MNKYRDRILKKGKDSGARIIFPEDSDKRVIEAISELKSLGFQIISYHDYRDQIDVYLDYINKLPFTKNWPKENLKEYLSHSLNFCMAMVACGDADGLVAGAITPSGDIIRASIRMIGVKPSALNVSSIFFMISPDGQKALTYGDCAVIPEPNSKELANIAKESAEFHKLLSGEEPIVAFLSFSTKGSAKHYRVEKVKEAVEIFGEKNPHIIHDGEIQLDAAIIPEVNKLKVAKSPIGGNANVLIFPNLDAGNIAYKLTERLAGYTAWGPLLNGLKKPVHDLSRGCTVDDIINVCAISALQKDLHAYV